MSEYSLHISQANVTQNFYLPSFPIKSSILFWSIATNLSLLSDGGNFLALSSCLKFAMMASYFDSSAFVVADRAAATGAAAAAARGAAAFAFAYPNRPLVAVAFAIKLVRTFWYSLALFVGWFPTLGLGGTRLGARLSWLSWPILEGGKLIIFLVRPEWTDCPSATWPKTFSKFTEVGWFDGFRLLVDAESPTLYIDSIRSCMTTDLATPSISWMVVFFIVIEELGNGARFPSPSKSRSFARFFFAFLVLAAAGVSS